MIEYLWARVSRMWLLSELGILLFCSSGFGGVGWESFARAFLLGRLKYIRRMGLGAVPYLNLGHSLTYITR